MATKKNLLRQNESAPPLLAPLIPRDLSQIKKKSSEIAVLLRDKFILVLDEIEATEEIAVAWQAHVRPENVRKTPETVMVTTPEGPTLRIVPARPETLSLTDVKGYPKHPSGGSVRVSWEISLRSGVLATLLVPEDDEQLCLGDGTWSGGYLPELDTVPPETLPSLSPPCCEGTQRAVVEALARGGGRQWRYLRASFTPPVGADYLRLGVFSEDMALWWNGSCILPARQIEYVWTRSAPVALPVSGRTEEELVVLVRPNRGYLLNDNGTWFRHRTPEKVDFKAHTDRWEIADSTVKHTVFTGAAGRKAGWETDARWLIVSSDGFVAGLDCRFIKGHGIAEFRSETRSHAAWDGRRWTIKEATLPTVVPPKPPRPLPCDEIEPGPPVGANGSIGHRVADILDSRNRRKLNGLLNDGDWRVERAAIERLGELGGMMACPALRQRLAEELKIDLYPPPCNVAPTSWEKASKLGCATKGDTIVPTTWEEDMAATGRDVGCKRFRVLQALIIALRKLGDAEALPLIRKVLETQHHFYPVYHAAVEFLGELGAEEDLARLEHWSRYPEFNASHAAKRALEKLKRKLR